MPNANIYQYIYHSTSIARVRANTLYIPNNYTNQQTEKCIQNVAAKEQAEHRAEPKRKRALRTSILSARFPATNYTKQNTNIAIRRYIYIQRSAYIHTYY